MLFGFSPASGWAACVLLWLWLQFRTTLMDRSPPFAIFADVALIGLTFRSLPLPWAALPTVILLGHLGIRLYRLYRRLGTRSGEPFWVRTPNGTPIYGETFSPPSDPPKKAVVIAHGISACAHDRLIHVLAAWLLEAGYAVFSFDEPGHCHSGGQLDEDAEFGLRAVLDEVKRRGFKKIGVIGLSLGAMLTLREASERNSFHAMVFVSGFGDKAAMLRRAALYTSPFGRFAMRLWGVRIAPVFDTPDPLAAGPNIRVPALVVHSRNDGISPFADIQAFYDALAGPKRLFVFDSKAHAEQHIDLHPDEFKSTVLNFLNEFV